jgi:hypothetical protein
MKVLSEDFTDFIDHWQPLFSDEFQASYPGAEGAEGVADADKWMNFWDPYPRTCRGPIWNPPLFVKIEGMRVYLRQIPF